MEHNVPACRPYPNNRQSLQGLQLQPAHPSQSPSQHEYNAYYSRVEGGVRQEHNYYEQASQYPSDQYRYQHTSQYYSNTQHATPHLPHPSTSREGGTMKSPRQQFSDSLRRGVQTFDYNPASGSEKVADKRGANAPIIAASSPSLRSLPARPDPTTWAAQGARLVQPQVSSQGNANRYLPTGSSLQNQSMQHIEQLQALPIPLVSRFPPLPPKPPPTSDSDDQEELRKKIFALEARETALILQIEALGFEPEAAWGVMNRLEEAGDRTDREKPAPILGIRLLQRLDLLQKENAELEDIFVKRRTEKSELQDAHRLIKALDKALTESTKRSERAEAALAVACAQVSTSITTDRSKDENGNASTSSSWKR
ncbi:hypothetical protein CBS101457_001753 [Exobasidium rhododendri]|nr:hypothetical protein CBS101457_001753 [Exobasidium rhododendri]